MSKIVKFQFLVCLQTVSDLHYCTGLLLHTVGRQYVAPCFTWLRAILEWTAVGDILSFASCHWCGLPPGFAQTAGEVALMESGLRTATVVAETDVTCLSLTRRFVSRVLVFNRHQRTERAQKGSWLLCYLHFVFLIDAVLNSVQVIAK